MKSEFFEIDMFQAGKGDCFLVRCGDQTSQTNIIIDTGMPGTEKLLIDRLDELGIKEIHLLVITHIDEDHIGGACEFLEQIEKRGNNKIQIGEIWHNSCVHLNLPVEELLKPDLIKANEQMARIKAELHTYNTASKQPISAGDGSSFSKLIKKFRYSDKWNKHSNHKAISLENINTEILIDKVKIKLLSPDSHKLNDLADFWNEKAKQKFRIKGRLGYSIFEEDSDYLLFLDRMKEEKKLVKKEKISETEGAANFEELLSDENLKDQEFSKDDSKTNGSSIAFTLEFANRKTLFLGDAHPKRIVSSLKRNDNKPLWFDFIKLSHHGSIQNLSFELLDTIDADKYIISTNGSGKAKHPNQSSIALIINKYKEDQIKKRNIISNYNSENLSKMKNAFDGKNNVWILGNEDNKSILTFELISGRII